MSAFDALLYRGDADPRTRAVLAAAYVLERLPDRGEVTAAFDRASREILRLRQHVVAPPWPVFLPAWVVDPDFDLARHLRFERLPPRAGLRHFLDAVQREMAEPLDPARPLWSAVVFEGLPRRRAGLLFRMSHAVTDGVGAVRLFAALFDTEAKPERRPLPPPPVPEDITPEELQRAELARLPATLLDSAAALAAGATRTAARAALYPRRSAARVETYLRSLGRIFGAQAKPSPLLAGRSLERRLLALDVPLDALKQAARAAEGSLNDAYLGAVAGALRLYHEALGAAVESLPVAIPVNLRRDDDPAEGNFFGAIVIAAPLDIADPAERIARIREQVRAGRAEPAIGAPGALSPLFARLPESVRAALAEGMPKPDIQASNVPASPVPIYVAGSRVERAWAFGPVPGAGAMLTLQSLAGTCHVGVNLDAAAFTDPALLARCLARGFEEVLALSGEPVRIAAPLLSHATPVRR
jgi:WS/DGAT/MGAT family acyltransferase